MERIAQYIQSHFPAFAAFLKKHGQRMANIYLFVSFGAWCGYQTWKTWNEGRLDYIEISFTVQNLILVCLMLIRRPHTGVDMSLKNQAVAIIAFMSGGIFMGQPPTGVPSAVLVSGIIIFIANVLGGITLLNLGRSFGILIALREVRTSGLYSIVRHPMYGTDILLRIGFLVSHLNPFTCAVFLLSTACYVYRAILEERFILSRLDSGYEEYMRRVKYRFIPYIF